MIFLAVPFSTVQADNVPKAAASAATLGDEALASYISGRLKLALKDDADVIKQYCDDSGCAVVVQ